MATLASYFIECLVYNVPSSEFVTLWVNPLTRNLRTTLDYIRRATASDSDASGWTEVNGIKPLFGSGQPWKPGEANRLAVLAQRHFGLE